MDIKKLKLLQDILTCLNQIEDYLGDKRIFSDYDNNSLLQDAVERNLITIGEAMNSLLKLNSEIEITNSRRIVDARNKLTHGYDDIEIVQIWNIIVNHLPLLKLEVSNLISQ
jgi:uncharacterized protein with HEPN domain